MFFVCTTNSKTPAPALVSKSQPSSTQQRSRPRPSWQICHSHRQPLPPPILRFLESRTCSTTLQTLHVHRIPNNPIRLLGIIANYLPERRILTLFAGWRVSYRWMPCLGPEVARGFLKKCLSKLQELTFGCKVKGDQPPELCSIVFPASQ